MKKHTYFFIIVLAIIITSSLIFIYISRSTIPLSLWGTEELIKFASYLGGTIVPCLTLLTFLILLFQLNVQTEQIEQLYDKTLEEQHIKMIDILIDDMNFIESTKIITSTKPIVSYTLGEILNDPKLADITNNTQFNKLIDDYVKLLSEYTESVALYRDNITPYFACRIFVNRGKRILEKLTPYVNNNTAQGMAIGMIKHQLEEKPHTN